MATAPFDASAFVAALGVWDPAVLGGDAGAATKHVIIVGAEGSGKSTLAADLTGKMGVHAVYAPKAEDTPTSSVGATPALQYILDNQAAMGAAAATVAFVRETVTGGQTAADNDATAAALRADVAASKVRLVATAQTPLEVPRRWALGSRVVVLLLPMSNILWAREAHARWVTKASGIGSPANLVAVLAALPRYTALVIDAETGTLAKYAPPPPMGA